VDYAGFHPSIRAIESFIERNRCIRFPTSKRRGYQADLALQHISCGVQSADSYFSAYWFDQEKWNNMSSVTNRPKSEAARVFYSTI